MKLDWSKIDNEKTFQNLVNHLFFLECPSVFGFVPFSPYIGPDGGWDGKYEGYYPQEDLDGLYCIQAKYTKHNLNDAMPSLLQWSRDELKKAKAHRAESYTRRTPRRTPPQADETFQPENHFALQNDSRRRRASSIIIHKGAKLFSGRGAFLLSICT